MTRRTTFKRLGIILLGAIVIAAVAAAILIPKATRLHAGAVAYVEANVPLVVADWNADALRQRAAPELLQQSDDAQMDALFAWFSSLGRLVALETPVGHIGSGTYPGSTFNGTWADFVANAQFEAGAAQVKIVLRRHDDSWRIIGFHITSAALLPKVAAAPTRHACPAQLQVDGQSHALRTVGVFDGPPADGRALVPEFDADGRGHWAFVQGQDSFHLQCGYGESRVFQVIAATGATRCRLLPAQAGAALQGLCGVTRPTQPPGHAHAVQAGQWLLVLLGPALALGIVTRGDALMLLPLAATLGIFHGLTSTAPFAGSGFSVSIALACIGCIALAMLGWRYRTHFAGKLLCSAGLYLWCVVGGVGFGPQ